MNHAKKKTAGPGCLILFATPFAAVGVVMFVLVGRTLVAAHGMQSWHETPANILHCELEESRGDDGTTYKVVARYTYEVDGRGYTATRVSLHGGSDNIGKFHQRTYRELEGYRSSKKPFPAYVNPDDPADAILYRRPRWEMVLFMGMFGVVFGGVGFGIMIAGLRGHRKKKVVDEGRRQHPDEPWLWRDDWTEGRIVSSNKTAMIALVSFAILWNVISTVPLVFILPEEVLEKGNRLALIGLVFPLVGIGLVAAAVHAALRWRKYGESVFEMAAVPGVIGGPLSGVVRVPRHLQPADGFRVVLNCVNRVTTGSGKNRSTSEHILHQDVRVMSRELLARDRTQSAIPVLFHIPDDCNATDGDDSDNCFLWRLEASAKVPGVDYATSFEIPVFRTAESSPDFVLDESAIEDYEAERTGDDVLRDAGIRVKALAAGGKSFYFPALRHLGTAMGLTVFLLIWTGAIVFMISAKAPLLFPVVFGLFELLFAFFALDLWFHTCRVTVSRGTFTIVNNLLGFRRSRSLAVDEIAEIRPARGMQSGNKVYYGIEIVGRDGKKISAGKRLDNRAQAEQVIAQYQEAAAQ